MAAVDAALMRYRRELLCCVILELSRHAVPLGEGEVRSVELAACKTLAAAHFHHAFDTCAPLLPKLLDTTLTLIQPNQTKRNRGRFLVRKLKYSLPLDRL